MLNSLKRASEMLVDALRPNQRKDLEAFLARAKLWKPAGFDEEMATRLAYYLGDQEEDLLAHLRKAFPLSWQGMPIHTIRVMRKVVDARSKLFGKDSRFTLVREATAADVAAEAAKRLLEEAEKAERAGALEKPKPSAAPDSEPPAVTTEDEQEPSDAAEGAGDEQTSLKIGDPIPVPVDSPEGKRWLAIQKACDLRRRLRTVNRWTEAMNTTVVVVGYDERKKAPTLRIFAPHFVHVDFDPDYPCDLDRAKGIMLEIAGPAGAAGTAQKLEDKRFEYWSADPARPDHFVMDGSGELVRSEGVTGENPYRDAEGRPIVPMVSFHSEELEIGFFTKANGDLLRSNRAINITLTDQHSIARYQGFGQVYIERDSLAGGEGKQQSSERDIAFGPDKAVMLRKGEKAGVLQTSPQLEALENMATADAKRATVLWDVPAGTVLADSRTAASAESLVVEREPLVEAREDQVDRYRCCVERLFDVIRIVNNTHAAPTEKLPEDARMTWEPGDLRIPFAPQMEQDVDFADLEKDLTTLPAILAKRRGISEEEAARLLEKNRETNDRFKRAPIAGPVSPVDGEDDPNATFRADEARAQISEGKRPPASKQPIGFGR